MLKRLLTPERVILALGIVTLLFCVVLVTDVVPWLRGQVPFLPDDATWIWLYKQPRLPWLLPCIAGVTVYAAAALYFLHRQSARSLLLWAFCGAALLPLLLMTLEGRPLYLLFARTSSAVIGGYQGAAAIIDDLGAALRHWPEVMRVYGEINPVGGAAIAPPGLIVIFKTVEGVLHGLPPTERAFSALLRPLQCQNPQMSLWSDSSLSSAWVQMAMPFWAALSVAPLYRLGVMIFGAQTGRWAAALYPLVPGVVLFIPRFNVLYVLLAASMLVFLWRGLADQRWRGLWLWLAGFVVSVGMFLNLAVVPLGLLGGVTILLYWLARRRSTPLRLADALLAFGLGCAVFWLVYGALSGVTLFDIMRASFARHLSLNRPYLPWLFLHPYDMYLFIGLPLAALSLWRIWRSRQLETNANIFGAAAGVSLVILVLSGTGRGETGRVWLFFAPLWLLLAADVLRGMRYRGAVIAMQCAVLLCMAAVVQANFTELTPVPAPPSAAPPAFPINARFVRASDEVTLTGLDVEQTEGAVALRLHWRAEGRYVRGMYQLALIPIAPDGGPRDPVSWIPYDGNYPPSCWLPGHEFADTVTVLLGADPPPGDWLFSLSIIDVFTRQPMDVVNASGRMDSQVGIGPVAVR